MKQKRLLVFDIIFFITMLLLIIASAVSYRNFENLTLSADRVNHTNLVQLELEKMLSYVKDAESSTRGYVITGDSVFIPPVASAMKDAYITIDDLQKLTIDNPVQQKNIQAVRTFLKQRFNRLEFVLSQPPLNPKNSNSALLVGRNIMEQLRAETDQMLRIEESLYEERNREKGKYVSLTPLFSLLFSILALLVVTLIYARLRKESQLRTKAESGEATIYNFFMQVPAMLAILKGKEQRFVFANPPYIELIGNRDIVGKTLLEALPELANQGFAELLDKVYSNGEPYIGIETKVHLVRNGVEEDVYMNFIYQAYAGLTGETEGVMVFCYDVSEMILNRRKIEELEQRSRLAIEASAMGIFDWDLQNQQFISSPRLLEIFGFGGEENVSHLDLLKRIHEKDKFVRDKAVIESYKNGSLVYEARVVWPDGSVHWINVYGIVVYNDRKESLRMYGSVIDITATRSVMEELKESESRFRLLADSLTQQVWTTDATGKMNYFNETVFNFSGTDERDFDKVGWMHTIHPDEKQDNLKKWATALENGQEFVSEHRLRDRNGNYRWHISRAIVQRDQNGKIQMWVGTSTDVQEQKNFSEELEKKVIERTESLFRMNIELKRSEDRYYSMVNEVQDYAIILLDRDGNIRNWNKGAEKINGYKADEIIGTNFRIFYQKEDRDLQVPERLIEESVNNGKAESLGWRIRKDGTRFWASVVITSLHDDMKNVIGFSKVTRDLTDKKEAEERQAQYLQSIEQKNIELEQSNAELQSFNYIASHDLQEPLRKIQAFSQLIVEKEKSNLSKSANDYFTRINKAAMGMQNLIDALISYSQANSAGVKLEETDLNLVLEEVKSDLSNSLENKNAVVDSEILPIVQADPVQFKQLFTNLISNAVKYSKPDVAPLIKISASLVRGKDIGEADAIAGQGYWKITFEDNGIGFDQKYEHKIFELFQRLHGKLEYQGTGIGLAICKKIMRNHEGFISAIGTLNSGAVFYIFLPLKNKFITLQP